MWCVEISLNFVCFASSESAFRISQKPSNPTIVVLGVNSSRVTLVWQYSDVPSQPSQYFVQFWRRKTGEKIKQISSSKDGNAFNPSNTEEFVARLDATLILKSVKASEKYTYSLSLLDSNVRVLEKHAVFIKVVGKWSCFMRFFDTLCLVVTSYVNNLIVFNGNVPNFIYKPLSLCVKSF